MFTIFSMWPCPPYSDKLVNTCVKTKQNKTNTKNKNENKNKAKHKQNKCFMKA